MSQLASDPSDREHLVLRSNFGLLTTRDRGENWALVCEAGVGYKDIEPAIALLSDGTPIVALPNGIARGSAMECEFAPAAGISGYVADVARVPGSPRRAVAVSVDVEASTSRVWRSLDGGESWSELGVPLTDLNAVTLDAAADGVIYVSGVAQTDAVTGVLARSNDDGQTWQRFEVPGASKVSVPYIAAVSSEDPNTLYVRLSGSPGRLLGTHDGGASLRTLLEFSGPFDGFALSPDGQWALASGRLDGVWRAPTTSLAFEQLSCARLRCLSWTQSGLFACADEFQAGFTVGESKDLGRSFEARLYLSCVRGTLACAAESSVTQACTPAWPAISEQLGADCAAAGTFLPNTECGSAGSAGNTESDGGGPGPATGGSTSGPLRSAGGCAFQDPRGRARCWPWGLAALGWLARRRKRPPPGDEPLPGRC